MILNGSVCCKACKWIRTSACCLFTGVALGLQFLGGCSKGAPRRTAKKEIRAANTAISHAESCASNQDYGYAIASLNEASSYVSKGKKYATGRQKTSLSSVSGKISRLLAEYELKKKKQDLEKAEEKAKKAEEEALAKANKETAKDKKNAASKAANELDEALDPAELARKIAAKKKAEKVKKVVNGADDLAAAMKASDKPKETTEEVRPSMDKVAGDGKEAGGEAKKEEPKNEGPYRAYGADRPSLSIDKVTSIGTHALVYLQLYNKNPQNNKRIGRVEVVFKDAGNGKLFDTRYVYVYEKFSTKKKDLFDQDDPMAALTGGSHEVFAGKTLKLVAVGESQVYAKKAAKAAVTVHYEDGSSDSDTGPGSLIDPVKKKSAIPGL